MCEVGEVAPRRVETHVGHVWVQVISRSVRSYTISLLVLPVYLDLTVRCRKHAPRNHIQRGNIRCQF